MGAVRRRVSLSVVRDVRLVVGWGGVVGSVVGGLLGGHLGAAHAAPGDDPAPAAAVASAAPTGATASATSAAKPAAAADNPRPSDGLRRPAGPVVVKAARSQGRLQANQLGLVINDNDPYSVAVGAHYREQRGLKPEQVLHVRLPVQARMTQAALAELREQADRRFGPQIQAVALAWRLPFAVQCQSVTAAFSLGFQDGICDTACAKGQDSPYFNSGSATPLASHGFRPSMLLAAPDEAQAKRLIDRGVAADGQLGRTFSPRTQAVFVQTRDKARNVRALLYPPAASLGGDSLRIVRTDQARFEREDWDNVILLQTGTSQLGSLDRIQFQPGALADHLTSYGGMLDGGMRQSLATDWLVAGATASHGAVSEPCNHPQKFPHPQLLLWHYVQGETAIEAYWKSVRWPAQSLFVGEPLAAPFARVLPRTMPGAASAP